MSQITFQTNVCDLGLFSLGYCHGLVNSNSGIREVRGISVREYVDCQMHVMNCEWAASWHAQVKEHIFNINRSCAKGLAMEI